MAEQVSGLCCLRACVLRLWLVLVIACLIFCRVFGEHRGKRHGVEEQFMRDFGSEMAAAVKEYTDAEGITDLGDSSLAALIDAVNAQETGEEGE